MTKIHEPFGQLRTNSRRKPRFSANAAPKRELNVMGQPYDGSAEKVA